MRNRLKYNLYLGRYRWALILLAMWLGSGCQEMTADRDDDYLIRVGSQVITVEDFHKAFENVKTAYPLSAIQHTATLKNARLMLLNQMIEELLLLERAEELQIKISDQEFEKSLQQIKQDYPEGIFDQMLLEYAVSYQYWKERLKIRLLMEKVVTRELAEQIVITAEDISKYYQDHYLDEHLTLDSNDASEDIHESIVKRLRREKAELVYRGWLKKLRLEYPVEINHEKWQTIFR